jgi:hypothetical protein
MSLELQGKVLEIGDVQEFNDGAFRKREMILQIQDGNYTQDIPLLAINNNVSLYDTLRVGDNIRVDINLRGNKYQEKHYLSANAWRISVVPKDDDTPVAAANDPVGEAPPTDNGDGGEEPDDLPF